jgi:hypothetical protein
VPPLYQTSPHKTVHESYNTVVLEIEPLGELANSEFLPPGKALDRQQCLVLLYREFRLAGGVLAERAELPQLRSTAACPVWFPARMRFVGFETSTR